MDLLGNILWILMFATPIITIPLAWKFSKQKKLVRILIGLIFALFLSTVLYFISIAVIFRNGMGPDSIY